MSSTANEVQDSISDVIGRREQTFLQNVLASQSFWVTSHWLC